MLEWPERDPDLEHVRTAPQSNSNCLGLTLINDDSTSFLVCDIRAMIGVFFQETGDPSDYEVKIVDNVFGFYVPYLAQDPIKISKDQSYTLATTSGSLGPSSNWVVCDTLGSGKRHVCPEKGLGRRGHRSM